MTNKAVNDFILAMDYDKKKLLTHQGESIENRFIKEGNQLPDEFVVIERKKRSLSTNTSDISVTATNDSRLYPGALLVVDETLLENNPTLLAVDRAPMTYSIDLPGLASSDSFLQVEDPSNSSVRGAVNDLLAKWHQDYGQVNNVPARMQYEKITAHSMEQLKVKFGSDFEKTGNSLDIDFNSVHSGEKQIQIVNFKQIYYTVSVDAVKNPGDVFQDTVTVEDLRQRGISAERPLVYISSVAYGRQVYLKLETTSKSDEVEAAFDKRSQGSSSDRVEADFGQYRSEGSYFRGRPEFGCPSCNRQGGYGRGLDSRRQSLYSRSSRVTDFLYNFIFTGQCSCDLSKQYRLC